MSSNRSDPPPQPTANGSAKRRRVLHACDRCKARKRRCDGGQPCALCQRSQTLCKYGVTERSSPPSEFRTLPQSSGHHVAFTDSPPPSMVPHGPVPGLNIQQSSRATSPGGEGDGFVQAGQYLGPTSTFSFLRRASRRLGRTKTSSEHSIHGAGDTSIFSLGDREVNIDTQGSNDLHLPSAASVDLLLSRYFDFAMPTYRFLHQPSMTSGAKAILESSAGNCAVLKRPADATLLVVLATALLYSTDNSASSMHSDSIESSPENRREQYFQKAQQILQNEIGMITIDSIQARLASVLYLLHTSRLNQAWYLLGTTQQLIVASGLHRSRYGSNQAGGCIVQECRRRCYWVAFTIDTYLSVMLGRPPLMNEQGVDQQLPTLANDENITAETTSSGPPTRDCVEAAPVAHAKLAQVMREAFALHYSKHSEPTQNYVEDVIELNRKIELWRQELPVFLSGNIHPFSLIPIFRRQLRVLQMAGAHATILVNRPLLFMEKPASPTVQPYVDICLASACEILDMVLELATNNDLFAAFWYFQYMTFHSLSVVYIWIILRKTGRLSLNLSTHNETSLFSSAEQVRSHLAKATEYNAPGLRYSAILQELSSEAGRILHKTQQVFDVPNAMVEQPQNGMDESFIDSPFATGSLDWDDAFSFPSDPDLWLQLDMFPFDNTSMGMDLDGSFA